MPKASRKNSKVAGKSDDNQRRDEILTIMSQLSASADVCRSIAEGCVTIAAETYEQQCRDEADRQKAATEILLGFQHFGEWCLMPQDSGEPDWFENNDKRRNWNAESEPLPIAIESWSASNVEIREAVKKQPTNEISVPSTPSLRKSKITKHRSSKRQSQTLLPFDTTVMIEKTEKETSADMTAKRKAFEKKLKNNQNAAAAASADKPSGDESVIEKKVIPEHNKNYTYDSSGKRIKMNPIRPDKIRSNIVTPVCTVITENENDGNNSQPQSKVNRTQKKKTKKPKSNQNKKLSDSSQEWKHSSIPLQPPPSKVIQLSEGVRLESEGMRINGPPIKKTTQNMNRTEYLQYLEAFRQLTDDAEKNDNSNTLDITNNESKSLETETKPQQLTDTVDNDRNDKTEDKTLDKTRNNKMSPTKAKRKAMIPSKKQFHASKPTNAPIYERNRAGLSSPLLSKTLYGNTGTSNEMQLSPQRNDTNKDEKIRKSKLGKVLFG